MSKFASLSAGLLARKGEAEPASSPFAEQLLTRVGAPASDISGLTPMHPHVHAHIEPGAPQKQQGFGPTRAPEQGPTSAFGAFGKRAAAELAKPPVTPALAPVFPHDDEEVADHHNHTAADVHCGACVGPAGDDAAKTFHVNLRLKRQRFVKLKLSAALLRRPVQDIVSEALDAWFEKLPADVLGDCACLRSRGEQ